MFKFEEGKSYNLMMKNGGSIAIKFEQLLHDPIRSREEMTIHGKYVGMPEPTNIQVIIYEIAAVAEMSEADIKRFEEAGKKQHEHYEQQMARLNQGQAPGSYI